jgi:hypothetical protein
MHAIPIHTVVVVVGSAGVVVEVEVVEVVVVVVRTPDVVVVPLGVEVGGIPPPAVEHPVS